MAYHCQTCGTPDIKQEKDVYLTEIPLRDSMVVSDLSNNKYSVSRMLGNFVSGSISAFLNAGKDGKSANNYPHSSTTLL